MTSSTRIWSSGISTCLLWLFCNLFPALAQHPLTLPVNPPGEYLPTNVFYAFRDDSDIMWLATNSGVYRYDGYHFEHFTSEDGLGDNEILRIFQDSRGRIWFQSLNGNPSYYHNGHIHNASRDPMLAKLKFTKMILSEAEDADGNVYIGARGSVYYKIDTNDVVTALSYFAFENYMWIGDDGTPKFIQQGKLTSAKPVRGSRLKGFNLAGQNTSIYRITADTILTHIFDLPANATEIIFLRIKKADEVYIGTRDGCFIWDPTGNKPLRHIMQGYSVSSVEFDFEDNTWLTTLESGAFMIPNLEVYSWDASAGLPVNKVTCLETDSRGNLWIGMTADHFARIDSTGAMHFYRKPEQSRLDITNIREYRDNLYIMGKSGILRMGVSGERSYGVYANDLFFYSDSEVLLAQDYTLRLERADFEDRLAQIVFNLNHTRADYELVGPRTNVIKAHRNTVYIGTSRGLYTYDGTIHYQGYTHEAFSYPVRDVAFDRNSGDVYIATLNGLLVMHNGGLKKVISSASGLPNSECNVVYVDANNTLWAAFGNAVVGIRRTGDQFSITNYTDILKISAARITDIESFNGRIYLATESGLISFDPKVKTPFTTAPKLQFGTVMVNNRALSAQALTRLKHHENDIAITYTGMSFISGDKVTYQYFLSGYDKEWHKTEERTIQFKSLAPGTYKFMVKATNTAGITSPVHSLSITVARPVWAEWWFIALTAVWVVAAVVLFWRYRLIRIKRNYEQEQRTIRLEMEKAESERMLSDLNQQAFRQQMNPHFIFNALNTIKGYYAENNIQQASDYISKFSKLLRNILENSEQVVPLEKEINAIQLYLDLAAMRYEHKFSYTIQPDPDLPLHDIGIPPMLIQPFLENALVHGIAPLQGQGHIQIQFLRNGNRLECRITDDGIGRQAAAGKTRLREHSSKATILITEYLKALNRRERSEAFTLTITDLQNKAGEAAGTLVVLSMPVIYL